MPKRKNKNNKSNNNNVDRMLANSMKATGSTTSLVASDFSGRRQNFNIVQRPPKNFINQIYWIKELTTQTFATSTTIPIETNIAFQLNNLGDSGNLASIFDQYCCYSATVSVSCDGTSVSNDAVTIFTAIDYDNVNNVGLTSLLEYSTCSESTVSKGTSLIRYIKPCIASNIYGSSGFGSFSTQRCWIDSNSTSVQWYGFRSIAMQTLNVATMRVNIETVWGFRSKW
jgi:hypothetical protein